MFKIRFVVIYNLYTPPAKPAASWRVSSQRVPLDHEMEHLTGMNLCRAQTWVNLTITVMNSWEQVSYRLCGLRLRTMHSTTRTLL
jgi:hypothetical protein